MARLNQFTRDSASAPPADFGVLLWNSAESTTRRRAQNAVMGSAKIPVSESQMIIDIDKATTGVRNRCGWLAVPEYSPFNYVRITVWNGDNIWALEPGTV